MLVVEEIDRAEVNTTTIQPVEVLLSRHVLPVTSWLLLSLFAISSLTTTSTSN